MFTGIIEEIGTVRRIVGQQISGSIEIHAQKILPGTEAGDSVAVNGVCLTVTQLRSDGFTADVMAETLRRTNLGNLSIGSRVNLERAMAADGRFGGHLVSGHIDGTGTVQALRREGNAVWVTITAPSPILRLIVPKGSIAIDGISLTVAYVDASCFRVSVIPHTGEVTTLLTRRTGDVVNLENDIIGKYVERLLSQSGAADAASGNAAPAQGSGGITPEFLRAHGF